MLYILKFIFIGHIHKWKIIKEAPCSNRDDSIWTRYYLQCEKCGNVKIT